MRTLSLAAAVMSLLPALAWAQASPTVHPAAPRLVVAELFTSQACSSCPPADALVTELVDSQPDLLALTFHVTYWNSLGWHDPFSLEDATERQRRYVALSVSPQVYTPAMVVDGRLDAVGSDRPAVLAALTRARQDQLAAATIDVTRQGSTIAVSVGSGVGRGKVVLLGYDRLHRTVVGRGENGGRTLRETNIVRSITDLGTWTGTPMRFDRSMPAADAAAVILQAIDGRILGAATVPGAAS